MENADRDALYFEALHAVLQTEPGLRVLTRMLEETGLVGPVDANVESIALHNFAERFFSDMAAADPSQASRIHAKLRGMGLFAP